MCFGIQSSTFFIVLTAVLMNLDIYWSAFKMKKEHCAKAIIKSVLSNLWNTDGFIFFYMLFNPKSYTDGL